MYNLQYTSETRTVPAFEWQISAGPDHLIARPFESRTSCPRISLDRFIYIYLKTVQSSHLNPGHKKCPRGHHSKAGQSGFRMYTVNEIENEPFKICVKITYFLVKET